ncbi:hypothetical protein VPH35_100669 [Triticum aestivum]|nr:uncharacterized protein LOC123125817 [Triticum aestivum]
MPWRRILANPGFRRRYREFHPTPPVLGILEKVGARIVAIPAHFPAQTCHPEWYAMDCRHGRALFTEFGKTNDLVVLDPVTGHHRRVPSPFNRLACYSAAVLCATQGCDHHGCQDGHFLVAVVCRDALQGVTLGRLYSSETNLWTELASVHHPDVNYTTSTMAAPSVLVGDTLYFNIHGDIECQLGTLCLSMFEKPIVGNGTLVTVEDGGLGFAALVDVTNLTLWSREAGLEGAMGWTKLRVIDLKKLVPDGALSIPTRFEFDALAIPTKYRRLPPGGLEISGFAEGTQVIFVCTSVDSYMVDLRSGRARKVTRHGTESFPYTSFYIPAMGAASPGQGR